MAASNSRPQDKAPRPGKLRRLAIGLGLAAVCVIGGARIINTLHLGIGASGSSVPAAAVALADIPAIVDQAKAGDVPIYLTGLGTVQALNTVTVKTRVDGQIQRIAFVEGQDVAKGDPLAQLDPRPFEAQKASAEATKARDEALLANAQLDLLRVSNLLKSDYTSRQSVDTQKALVAQYEAAVKIDQGQINYASIQLGYTTVASPISGRVGMRLVDEGNIVRATDQTGIVTITQVEPIAVVFSVPEDALDDIRAATGKGELAVEAFGRNDKAPRAIGKLLMVDNQVDQTTGSIKLKATFENKNHALWPGQFVNVRLLLDTRKDGITVPAPAVQRGPDGTYAYLVKADRSVEMRPILVAQIRDGIALIDKGLAAGDQVVIDGQYKLKPGVRIAAQAASAAPVGATAGAAP